MSNSIFKKMALVMAEIGSIEKSQRNQAQGYAFRGIDQFVNALNPVLIKHEVFISPRCTSCTSEIKEVTRSNGKAGIDKHASILMEYDFIASDGSKVTIGPIPAEGVDSGDKATNKALSAALKYALIQTFSIPTQDMEEADRESPVLGAPVKQEYKPSPEKLVTDPQINRLIAICKSSNWSQDALRTYINKNFGKNTSRLLNQIEYESLCKHIQAFPVLKEDDIPF